MSHNENIYDKQEQAFNISIFGREYSRKYVYGILFEVEKKLNVNHFAEDYLLEIDVYSDEFSEILKYMIFENNQDLLIFAPKLTMLFLLLITKYEDLEDAKFYTLSRLLQKFKSTFYFIFSK